MGRWMDGRISEMHGVTEQSYASEEMCLLRPVKCVGFLKGGLCVENSECDAYR